ncbi:hypothetical protein HWV00_10535 [Moritella sp. 24]|uniref:CsiV family protein n=1 Tax=Moritella sp. 24 TaxID=2746230 RepID=UPI001BA4A9B2|nr:CsiV family protein [Moritella sp. 24]QUM76631.1 hypothetical protein HWV00_10535 [Moritella sp. 24]
MKKSLISLLVGLSVGSSFAVSAAEEERWFEVEVILFERNLDPAKVIEHWDQSLYPTYSKKNKDPMALFINNDNLITPNGTDNSYEQALTSNVNGVQPTLIDGSDTLPVFGSDQDNLVSHDQNKDANLITATNVVIDGANLKDNIKDPALQIVPANELQLAEQFTALNDHANYNVVLHTAWRMQPKARNAAIPIRLFAGQNYQQSYKQNGDAIIKKVLPVEASVITEDLASINNVDSANNVIDLDNAATINDGIVIKTTNAETVVETVVVDNVPAEAATPVWKIDGELTIYLEHYLYAKTDLFVRKEGTKTLTAPEMITSKSMNKEVATNIEKVDLLELLGIHLEPKQANHQDILLANAQAEAENFVIDEVVPEQVLTEDGLVLADDNALPQGKKIPFLNSYPMQQLRVIRSGEIHYLDHPMFGMLIQIRKYEPPMPEVTEEEATQ